MDKSSSLPNDPDALRAIIVQMADEAVATQAELSDLKDTLAACEDERRRVSEILETFKRHRFDQKSERLDPDQYELILEEVETTLGRISARLESVTPGRPRSTRRSNRGSLPARLERIEQIVDIEDKACACCGGSLHVIGEDVSERLDVVPTLFRVLVTRRPRYGCRGCDDAKVIQAPAPNFIVDQGLPTDALVAQVVVSRYADHQPLYRQAQIYSRQGIHLDRSTLADWVGRTAWWLQPLRQHLLDYLRGSPKLFADETTMPVLAPRTGKTKKGQLWAYARDDRPWASQAPPAIVYMYATSRSGREPVEHLKGFAGILQVDGYAGYNRIGRSDAVTLAYCLSHARRQFYEFKGKEAVADEVLRRFAVIYKAEAVLRGKSPEERLAGRRQALSTLLPELKAYLTQNKRRFSLKGKMTEAIDYTLNHWDGLTRFMQDGRIELDNNTVERAIRPIALSRKNSLFAGSDLGADNWAIIASLLETCKLNDVDPLAWLTCTLTKLANAHSARDIDALMPWHFPKITN